MASAQLCDCLILQVYTVVPSLFENSMIQNVQYCIQTVVCDVTIIVFCQSLYVVMCCMLQLYILFLIWTFSLCKHFFQMSHIDNNRQLHLSCCRDDHYSALIYNHIAISIIKTLHIYTVTEVVLEVPLSAVKWSSYFSSYTIVL